MPEVCWDCIWATAARTTPKTLSRLVPRVSRHWAVVIVGDGGVVRGPDAVVEDDAVEAAEDGDGGGDEGLAIFGSGERLLDGAAEVGASALCDEGLGLLGGGAVAEDYLRPGLMEEANGRCADSAGASGDEGDFARQRHYDT